MKCIQDFLYLYFIHMLRRSVLVRPMHQFIYLYILKRIRTRTRTTRTKHIIWKLYETAIWYKHKPEMQKIAIGAYKRMDSVRKEIEVKTPFSCICRQHHSSFGETALKAVNVTNSNEKWKSFTSFRRLERSCVSEMAKNGSRFDVLPHF